MLNQNHQQLKVPTLISSQSIAFSNGSSEKHKFAHISDRRHRISNSMLVPTPTSNGQARAYFKVIFLEPHYKIMSYAVDIRFNFGRSVAVFFFNFCFLNVHFSVIVFRRPGVVTSHIVQGMIHGVSKQVRVQ